MNSFSFDGSEEIDVQTTLDVHISHESKSLDNINSIDNNLNSYPPNVQIKRGDVNYTQIAVNIPSNDYDFIYGRFEQCMGETNELVEDFFEESIVHQVDLMRNDDDEHFTWEISIPKTTMKKLNGMIYHFETKGDKFIPITLDDFIVYMVDALYPLDETSYQESGERLSRILEEVFNDQ